MFSTIDLPEDNTPTWRSVKTTIVNSPTDVGDATASEEWVNRRLSRIEATLEQLSNQLLGLQTDSDDEEVRLESELDDSSVHPLIEQSVYAVYDALSSVMTSLSVLSLSLQEMTDEGEQGQLYDSIDSLMLDVSDPIYTAKKRLGDYIALHTPDVFHRPVEEGEDA